MPTLTVKLDEETKKLQVEEGRRLVLALEDNDIDVSHRCGGWAKCTTCQCEFIEGEPENMTNAERDILEQHDDMGEYRLSCQIRVEDDMTVTPLKRVQDMQWDNPGARPSEKITPQIN